MLDIYHVSLVITLSVILLAQGIFTLAWMLYAWDNPEYTERNSSPQKFNKPYHSFTALVPLRNEKEVIEDTLKAISAIRYPSNLKETLVLCRLDDSLTIAIVENIIESLSLKNVRLITFNGFPINKPHALNHGLKEAAHNVIAIFDAEDEPHPDIYNVVNTVLLKENVDIVQSGIQLMNYKSHWFSMLNVLEYFFWFKSGLQFFSRLGQLTPLGGNTIFIKKHYLERAGGWDENCLTEDMDLSIRLTLLGAKSRVVYDEKHTTREETPISTACFIKQRTRWDQGFLQVFFKGNWLKLPRLRQRVIAAYILLSPTLEALLLVYAPFAIWSSVGNKIPVLISMISFLPLLIFLIQMMTYIAGFYEFTKAYKLRCSPWSLLKILATYYPYQIVLAFSSIRAVERVILHKNNWEKTSHINAHRHAEIIPQPC